jgi:hypothetical protein
MGLLFVIYTLGGIFIGYVILATQAVNFRLITKNQSEEFREVMDNHQADHFLLFFKIWYSVLPCSFIAAKIIEWTIWVIHYVIIKS